MLLSEKAYSLAETILKHHTITVDSSQIQTATKAEMDEMLQKQDRGPQTTAGKVSLDYSKW